MVRNVVFVREHDMTFAPTMHFGPTYWVFTGYLYILIAWSLLSLGVEWRSGSRLARRQSMSLLLGVVVGGLIVLATLVWPLYAKLRKATRAVAPSQDAGG